MTGAPHTAAPSWHATRNSAGPMTAIATPSYFVRWNPGDTAPSDAEAALRLRYRSAYEESTSQLHPILDEVLVALASRPVVMTAPVLAETRARLRSLIMDYTREAADRAVDGVLEVALRTLQLYGVIASTTGQSEIVAAYDSAEAEQLARASLAPPLTVQPLRPAAAGLVFHPPPWTALPLFEVSARGCTALVVAYDAAQAARLAFPNDNPSVIMLDTNGAAVLRTYGSST